MLDRFLSTDSMADSSVEHVKISLANDFDDVIPIDFNSLLRLSTFFSTNPLAV
jgi:hypothetical protein